MIKETSRETFAKSQKQLSLKLREEYNKDPKHCKFCNEKIPYEKKNNDFCNCSCSTSLNNIGTVRNKNGFNTGFYNQFENKGIYKCFCMVCKDKFNSSFKAQIFCSFSCQTSQGHKTKRGEWISLCEQRQEFIGHHANSNCRRPKKYLIEKLGHKCSICEKTLWNKQPSH